MACQSHDHVLAINLHKRPQLRTPHQLMLNSSVLPSLTEVHVMHRVHLLARSHNCPATSREGVRPRLSYIKLPADSRINCPATSREGVRLRLSYIKLPADSPNWLTPGLRMKRRVKLSKFGKMLLTSTLYIIKTWRTRKFRAPH